MNRSNKERLKRGMRSWFEFCQRFGFDVLPRHFYSSIPDVAALKKDPYWRKPNTMTGVRGMDIEDQKTFLQEVCRPEFLNDFGGLYEEAVRVNGEDGGYGFVEAQFLYCFIRSQRPPKVVQVGCGVSTYIILTGARHEGYTPRVKCIEPYPTDFLKEAAMSGQLELVPEPAQKVELEEMLDIDEGGMLFIDSTHTVKVGSEVNRIIFEVLPRLSTGVWVHFHDIFFPYDYHRRLMKDRLFFWGESGLLHAFLINNCRFEVAICQSLLHYKCPEALAAVIPSYDPKSSIDGLEGDEGEHFPASIYLKVTDDITIKT